jgi:hypothetical protein
VGVTEATGRLRKIVRTYRAPRAHPARRSAGPLRPRRLPGVQPPSRSRREARGGARPLLHRPAGLGVAPGSRAKDRAPGRSPGGRVPVRAAALRAAPPRGRVRGPPAPRPRAGHALARGDVRALRPRSGPEARGAAPGQPHEGDRESPAAAARRRAPPRQGGRLPVRARAGAHAARARRSRRASRRGVSVPVVRATRTTSWPRATSRS